MAKNKKNKNTINLKDWLAVCVGICIICLSVVAMTGETYVGSLLTYLTSYAFGSFSFLLHTFFVLLGLSLVIRKKAFPLKGNGFIITGLVLLFVSLLSFGSYSIFANNSALSFTEVTSFYNRRMQGFASSIFSIDSYENLGTLGGGYIGLFINALLGSIWTSVGNAILFIVLLILGLFFVSYRPIEKITLEIKKHKSNKVSYDSPFHPVKGKENDSLDRNKEEQSSHVEIKEEIKPNPDLCKPLEKDWKGNTNPNLYSVFKTSSNDTFSSQTPVTTEFEKKSIQEQQNQDSMYQGFRNQPVTQPVMEEVKPVVIPTPVKQPERDVIDIINHPSDNKFENSADFSSVSPVFSKSKTDSYAEPKTNPVFEQSKPVVEERRPVYQESKPVIEKPKPVVEESKPVVKQPTPTYPRVNPLEAVAKNVQPKAVVEHTVTVESKEPAFEPVPEEAELENEQLSREEQEKQIEKAYFLNKQKKAIEAIQEKRRQKLEKQARLMRFCSDVPKIYNYALPNDSLLLEHDDSEKLQVNNQSAEEKVRIINGVFRDYNVKAKATTFTVGASVTRFNIETEPGERSDHIESIVEELQKALNGDKSVRVETVVEGRSTSGVEVGNIAPMAVSFKDVFENVETNTKDNLLLPIGKDISGNIITYPLNKMPHVLIAGTTGSGKSVLVHSMIMTLIMRNYPSQMKLILIDPKQVEFIRYQECSHLFCPVISKPETAVLALKKLCDEMERRFNLLSNYRVANLEAYNELRIGKEAAMPEMPYLVCVIDEFADLIMVGGKDVSTYVQRIGQKARAAGIHLIIATQRPSKDNVPMMIKANVPCRIGLSCSSQVDSRVILDENGAETLLGRGDLLFKSPTKKSLIRAQSPFLSDQEIDFVLKYVKEAAGDPVYDKEFIELEQEDDTPEIAVEADPNKRLYDDVKDFVVHTGFAKRENIVRNFQVSNQKADTFLMTMVSEGVLMLGYNNEYVLGPGAQAILDQEGK